MQVIPLNSAPHPMHTSWYTSGVLSTSTETLYRKNQSSYDDESITTTTCTITMPWPQNKGCSHFLKGKMKRADKQQGVLRQLRPWTVAPSLRLGTSYFTVHIYECKLSQTLYSLKGLSCSCTLSQHCVRVSLAHEIYMWIIMNTPDIILSQSRVQAPHSWDLCMQWV